MAYLARSGNGWLELFADKPTMNDYDEWAARAGSPADLQMLAEPEVGQGECVEVELVVVDA